MPPKKKAAVSEPIQVYLTAPDRAMLDRAALATQLSRAEVLRRGLRSFSATVLADVNPVVGFLDAMAAEPWPKSMPKDAAARHDEFLTDPDQPRRKTRKR
jgi:hypothetical protein